MLIINTFYAANVIFTALAIPGFTPVAHKSNADGIRLKNFIWYNIITYFVSNILYHTKRSVNNFYEIIDLPHFPKGCTLIEYQIKYKYNKNKDSKSDTFYDVSIPLFSYSYCNTIYLYQ